jgi:hypothetical protein
MPLAKSRGRRAEAAQNIECCCPATPKQAAVDSELYTHALRRRKLPAKLGSGTNCTITRNCPIAECKRRFVNVSSRWREIFAKRFYAQRVFFAS